MFVGRLPVFAYVGMVVFFLTVLQVLMGRRTIKVNFRYHRINGYVILTLGFLHGLMALAFFLVPR